MFFGGFVCARLHVCVWLIAAVYGVARVGLFVIVSRSVAIGHLTMWWWFAVGFAWWAAVGYACVIAERGGLVRAGRG